MTNAEIASLLEEVADLLEFEAANPFRIRAYRNGARTLGDLPDAVAELVADPARSLTDIEGIGKDLADKITTLVETGSLPLHQELLSKIPASVLAILRIPGLGPKRASALYNQLHITTLDELREACQTHQVRQLKGFGAKTEATIMQGLALAGQAEERLYWVHADEVVGRLIDHLSGTPGLNRLEPAGSYRRCRETVGDLDLLAVAGSADRLMDQLASFPGIEEVLLRGETKMSVRLASRVQVDLRVVPADSFGAALQYFTGSKEHNVQLRSRAKRRKLKINEYGVFRGRRTIAGPSEEGVYEALGLPWIPPELREARQEFRWAESGNTPELVGLAEIKGDLHAHSTWTDGRGTMEEMARAAMARGLEYLAITDHSKRVAMVGGLDARRLRTQWLEIDRLNAQFEGFRLLKGVEVDILEAGGLDLDDDVLAEADWVMASVHYGQNQSEARITRRIIEAIENPYVSAIAHPTGRMINQRPAYEIDLDAVLHAAGEHGTFMELNSNPTRLDLDDVACAAAKRLGVAIVISTDSHKIESLDLMRLGVMQARRGGLTAADVVNTRSWGQLQQMLPRTRKS